MGWLRCGWGLNYKWLDFGLTYLIWWGASDFDDIFLLHAGIGIELITKGIGLILRLPSSIFIIMLIVRLFESILLSMIVRLIVSLVEYVSVLLRRVELIANSLTLVWVIVLVSRRLEVILTLRELALVIVLCESSVTGRAWVRVTAFTLVYRALDQPTADACWGVVLEFLFGGLWNEFICAKHCHFLSCLAPSLFLVWFDHHIWSEIVVSLRRLLFWQIFEQPFALKFILIISLVVRLLRRWIILHLESRCIFIECVAWSRAGSPEIHVWVFRVLVVIVLLVVLLRVVGIMLRERLLVVVDVRIFYLS